MKKLISTLVLGASLVFPSLAVQAETKVAVIDVQRIFQEMPQAQESDKRIRDEFEPRAQEIRKLEDELQALLEKRERDAALMSEADMIQMNRKLQSLDNQYKQARGYFEEDRRKRSVQEQGKLMAIIEAAVITVAESGGYDLVLPLDATAYFSNKLDVTEQVIQEATKAK
ncbi:MULTISPECIES: OmpH family outer membrane protein [Aliagarivorans]|uniref:OmpH family outer membrane protein n=1 Tax=Aliagarivorans TaxID=882379 RepID=UPI0004155209|nr:MULTISPECIES: OmpH family outer membrane protein [Aliagarivorans]